jgi:alpha-tubulin suppressor-like RCC1 family protein
MGFTSIFQSLYTSRMLKFIPVFLLVVSLAITPVAQASQTQAQPENSPDPAVNSAALNFTRIVAGDAYTCALTTAGGVKCWGSNGSSNKSIPVDVSSLTSGVTVLAAGLWHTCAVAGGVTKCWGMNGSGELGNGSQTPSNTPVQVSGLASGVTALATGNAHTCAVTAAGGVKCWGDNQARQLGDGTNDWNKTTPVDVVGLSSGVVALAAGDYHTCALMDAAHNRAVKCWGWNSSGQLGDGTTTNRTTPVDVGGLTGVTALVAGDFHTCALTSGGGIKCWGENSSNQLGDGTSTQRNAPWDVISLGGSANALSAGRVHTCAVVSGMAKCWGDNGYGQLGNSSITTSSIPVTVSGLTSGTTAVAAGGDHSCALVSGGGAKCWGNNNSGQLGDGTVTQRSIPVDLNSLGKGIITMAAGWQHTCVVTADGGVQCWGINGDGQLGDGTTTSRSTPVNVSSLASGFSVLAAGRWHTCAGTATGGVKCWGRNATGQLGNNSNTPSTTPVNVSNLTGGVKALAAGWYHTCALTNDGGVKCWGDNGYGELGDGSGTQQRTPVNVSGLSSGVIALAAGDTHTCAVMDIAHGGGVKCWGWNSYGQIGDGSNTTRPTPVDVSGLSGGIKALASGSYHTCAVTAAGGVTCWGDGDKTPVAVASLASNIVSLAAGGNHTCALTTVGAVKCWGDNWYGQVGDGTTTWRSAPVAVSGLAGVTSLLVAGAYHTCALMTVGGGKCWGSDGFGQLGIGTIARHLTPVDVVESVLPQLTINYTAGKPGTTFTLTGWNFPVSANVTISVNTYVYSATVPVNATGSFIFFLTTLHADQGSYNLSATSTSSGASVKPAEDLVASANPNAVVNFFLYNGAALHLLSGGGQTLDLPAGIAGSLYPLYLPLVVR